MFESLSPREGGDWGVVSLSSTRRVIVVHDYLAQRGGAERVLLSMMKALPEAKLFTGVYNADKTFPEFRSLDIRTTWLQRIPAFRSDPRLALAFLDRTFGNLHIPDSEVVVCSTSGWAHGVRTSAPKIVYCHNPPRWLYQTNDYASEHSLPVRLGLELLRNRLTKWDRLAARQASAYLANSSIVRERIMRTYGIEAKVLPPPISLDPSGPTQSIEGVPSGFLLAVSRARGYKNSSVLAEAISALPGTTLLVVGSLPVRGNGLVWPKNIIQHDDLTDSELRWAYANCSALVGVSHEDFGLTPLEANMFGKPVVCLRAGGYLDTVKMGVTGLFIEGLSLPSIQRAIEQVLATVWDPTVIKEHAERYSEDAFCSRLRAQVDAVLDKPIAVDRSTIELDEHAVPL